MPIIIPHAAVGNHVPVIAKVEYPDRFCFPVAVLLAVIGEVTDLEHFPGRNAL